MVFNSLGFAVLLTCVFISFYYAKDSHRWVVLLIGSVVFYAALRAPHLLIALAFVTIVSYACALAMRRSRNERRRQLLLWMGIVGVALVLVYLRFLPFLIANLCVALTAAGSDLTLPEVRPLVAIGVSFYVFQAISYLVDVYLEVIEPEAHLGRFAVYIAFFPKLLQGPIERGGDLLPQLRRRYDFSQEAVRAGLFLFALGLFKKIVIADRLGVLVDPVYADVQSYTGLPLIVATYAYAFQIYFDFSGYTDMAIGAASLFGIKLTDNFRSPYLANSIPDFWRRWHITFSRWILDYIFRPLQLTWRSIRGWGTALALLVTFFVSGLWHGTGWNYIIWGLMHGVYMVASVLSAPYHRRAQRALRLEGTAGLRVWQVVMTFNLVSLAWIFFRASSAHDALFVATHLVTGLSEQLRSVLAQASPLMCARQLYGVSVAAQWATKELAIALTGLVLFYTVQVWHSRGFRGVTLFRAPTFVRWAVYYAIVVFMLLFGSVKPSQYIYFDF